MRDFEHFKISIFTILKKYILLIAFLLLKHILQSGFKSISCEVSFADLGQLWNGETLVLRPFLKPEFFVVCSVSAKNSNVA